MLVLRCEMLEYSVRKTTESSATSQLVKRSSHHTVMSSHGQLVTHTSHHTVNSSQDSTREHITNPPILVVIILSVRPQETSRNSAQHGRRNYRYLCYFHVHCRLQITATNDTSAKSTVNSSKRLETRRSTRHTILPCDELTV